MSAHGPMPKSAWIFPALAMLLFAAATGLGLSFTPSVGGFLFAATLLAILFGTVFAAVHHAEVIAERIGEPYGAGADLFGGAAWLCGPGHAHALRRVPLYPDDPA